MSQTEKQKMLFDLQTEIKKEGSIENLSGKYGQKTDEEKTLILNKLLIIKDAIKTAENEPDEENLILTLCLSELRDKYNKSYNDIVNYLINYDSIQQSSSYNNSQHTLDIIVNLLGRWSIQLFEEQNDLSFIKEFQQTAEERARKTNQQKYYNFSDACEFFIEYLPEKAVYINQKLTEISKKQKLAIPNLLDYLIGYSDAKSYEILPEDEDNGLIELVAEYK